MTNCHASMLKSKSKKHQLTDRLAELTQLSDAELGEMDIALLNLTCAQGLPGGERIDVAYCIRAIDAWAQIVQKTIDHNRYRFERDSAESGDTFAQWLVGMMVTVLQLDIGVRYNPALVENQEFPFLDSRDVFIHGIIVGEGGSCSSLPVLYAAVGRRLGFPLKLVHALGHVFCRWDDRGGQHPAGRDRFNIEGASRGFNFHADDHYLKWPMPLNETHLSWDYYLRSLSPRAELGSFLGTRGVCQKELGRFAEASQSFAWAAELCPKFPGYAFYARRMLSFAEKLRNASR
jgi:hypothetical protein